jgi:hypothetical protein
MMTDEKPTMADMSGGKRDRSSDHTDKPATTPNTRDSKLLCNDDKEPIGKGNEGKLVEIEQKLNSAAICNDDDGVTSAPIKPDQKEVIDVDDLDSIIASGGLVESPGSDTEEHVPKTLFDPTEDKTDETTEVTKPSDVHDNDSIANALANFSTPIKNKQIDDNSTPTSTEKNNNKNNNKKTEKEQKNKQDTNSKQQFNKGKKNATLILKEGFKLSTKNWKDADSKIKATQNLAYKPADKEKRLILNRASFLKHFKRTDEEDIGRDTWIKYFITAIKLGDTRAFRAVKRFGMALASTDPTELFLPHQFDGKTLLEGPIENAWAGAYIVYGAAWKPEIGLDISGGINAPSTWWKNLGTEVTSQLAPFSPSEVFSDNEGSMHDQEQKLKKTLGLKHTSNAVPIKDWITGFKKSIKDPSVQAILIKLALTPITVFDQAFFAEQNEKTKLNSVSVTNFWIGAYRIAGAPWNLKSPPPTEPPASSKPTFPKKEEAATATPSPKQDHVSFDSATKKEKAPGLFISRSAHKPATGTKPKADDRKYQDIYYTVTTPPMDSGWKEGGPEITVYFNNIFEHIIDKDKKALIHQWKGKDGGRLSKHSAKLSYRLQVAKYCNSLFLKQGSPVVFRIRVSHDVHPSKIIIDNVNEGLHLEKDHIQERDLTVIGYLVGSSPAAANLKDMQESHENHPILNGLKIEARVQAIKLTSGKNLIPYELQVRAVHIIVGESQANIARDKYNQVFGSRNVGGFPQAIHMRFIPDISDSRFPVTLSTRVKAIKMLAKQKAFLASTKQIRTNTIAGLHILNSKVGHTLCQVLMSIRSVDYPEYTLFTSVDDHLSESEYEVIFTAHNDRFNEANSLVPLLCILLEAKFGIPIKELGWFTDDAKRVVTKYKWDYSMDCVVLIHPDDENDDLGFESDDDYMKSICNIFNIDSEREGNGFEFNMEFVIEDDIRPKNQYGDDGSVKTFRHASDKDGGEAEEAFEDATEFMDTTPSAPTPDKKPAALPSLEELSRDNPALLRAVIAKYHISNPAVSPEGVDGN